MNSPLRTMTKRVSGPSKRPSRSEIFAVLKLRQNCSLFEEGQLAFYVRSHLDKFSVLYDKTLQPKEQQAKIDTFFTVVSLVKMGIFF